jgi:hypothetical protein
MNPVEPLPRDWCESVIRILRKGDPVHIRWTLRAQMDWSQFGLPFQACELLLRILGNPGLWGERITGMLSLPGAPKGRKPPTVFAFLCDHPLGLATPLYAKIGLHDDHLSIDLFSLHIDLSGDLASRIARARKKQP